jgi:bifunctional DNase/RNase
MTLLQLSAQSFARPGAVLDVTPLALPESLVVTYEWFVDDEEAPRASGLSFQLPLDLSQSAVTARASYVDDSGATVVVFSPSIQVNAAPTGLPVIAGTFEEDGLVSVVTPSAIADQDGTGELPLAYQWLADGVAIPNAVGEFWVLSQAQVGKSISVQASYTDGDGKPESLTSKASAAVRSLNDPVAGSFRIDGSFAEDQTLQAVGTDVSDEDGLPAALTYLWKADGVLIQGANSNRLVLGQAQVGKTISLTVQFNDLQNSLESIAAYNYGQVSNVNDPTTGQLKIAGLARQGTLLQADTSGLQDEDRLGSFSYQWLQDGVEIAGATQPTFLLNGQAFVGKTIGLQVVHTDLLGTTEPMLSAQTEAIANLNDLPTGSVSIEGDGMEDATLTASHTLKDVDGGTILPIWVGMYEANAIALEIEKVATPRPMTHDLIKTLLAGLETNVSKVVVNELKDDTFYAMIWLEKDGELITVDSRPSDALALALRTDCPIYVDEQVIRTSKATNSVSDKVTNDELKRWLESLNDEDLGRYKM